MKIFVGIWFLALQCLVAVVCRVTSNTVNDALSVRSKDPFNYFQVQELPTSCRNERGEVGTCESIFSECSLYLRDKEIIFCRRKGEGMGVCCIHVAVNQLEDTTSTTSTTTTTSSTTPKDAGEATAFNELGCGRRWNFSQPRIFGGKNAPDGKWPWMVGRGLSCYPTGQYVIYLSISMGHKNRHFCGATLVNENWAITAAHCFRRFNTGSMPSSIEDVTLRLGDNNRLAMREGLQERRIKHFVVHPDYNYYFDMTGNDIAMVQFDEPVVFKPTILPICLPPSDIDVVEGQIAYVAGWGRKQPFDESPPHFLQELTVSVINDAICGDSLRPFQHIPSHDMRICVKGEKASSNNICMGDSGGPLIIRGPGGRWILVGIASASIMKYEWAPCGDSVHSIFTTVSKFTTWINDVQRG